MDSADWWLVCGVAANVALVVWYLAIGSRKTIREDFDPAEWDRSISEDEDFWEAA